MVPSPCPPGALDVTGDRGSSGSPSGSVRLGPVDWGGFQTSDLKDVQALWSRGVTPPPTHTHKGDWS